MLYKEKKFSLSILETRKSKVKELSGLVSGQVCSLVRRWSFAGATSRQEGCYQFTQQSEWKTEGSPVASSYSDHSIFKRMKQNQKINKYFKFIIIHYLNLKSIIKLNYSE